MKKFKVIPALLIIAISSFARPPHPPRGHKWGRMRYMRSPDEMFFGSRWVKIISERIVNLSDINSIAQIERKAEMEKAQVQIKQLRMEEKDLIISLSKALISGEDIDRVKQIVNQIADIELKISKIKLTAIERIMDIEKIRNDKIAERVEKIKELVESSEKPEDFIPETMLRILKIRSVSQGRFGRAIDLLSGPEDVEEPPAPPDGEEGPPPPPPPPPDEEEGPPPPPED